MSWSHKDSASADMQSAFSSDCYILEIVIEETIVVPKFSCYNTEH